MPLLFYIWVGFIGYLVLAAVTYICLVRGGLKNIDMPYRLFYILLFPILIVWELIGAVSLQVRFLTATAISIGIVFTPFNDTIYHALIMSAQFMLCYKMITRRRR